MEKYQVYIIHSQSKGKFYVGFTSDAIEERIRKHNTNHNGFTGSANDWELKYIESFDTKAGAMKRENE